MRWLMAATLAALTAMVAILPAPPAAAQGDICDRLWVARNTIYKVNGYCFKTARAISYFGNAGCVYDWEGAVPLTRGERARLGRIQADERAYGCR